MIYGTSVFLAVFLGFTLLVHEAIRRWKNRKLIKFMSQFDGPISLPIIGTLHIFLKQLTTTNVARFILNFIENAPETSAHWINGIPYLVTYNREIFTAITMNTKNMDKTRDYDYFKVLSNGIFTAAGNSWRQTRKMINPGFRSNVLSSFGGNLNHHMDIFIENVNELVNSGEELDVFHMVHSFTLDALCENMMGVRLDFQRNKLYNYSKAMERSVELFFHRVFIPALWPDFIYSHTTMNKEIDVYAKELRQLAEKVLNKRIDERESQKQEGSTGGTAQPFMDLLLNSIELGTTTREQCIEEIIEIFLAGSMTSAIVISWMIKGAALCPHFMDKLYEEIVEVCGVRRITYDDLSKLPYLDMLVKEMLRHVTLPAIARDITTELKVNDSITIPPGVQVILSLYGLHHDPKYWEKPNAFYPEHFSPENEIKRPKGVYMPFSSGPRNCPGNTYGKQTIKCLIANLVLNFEVTSSDPTPKDLIHDLYYRIVFLIFPTDRFKVRFKQRAKVPERLPTVPAA